MAGESVVRIPLASEAGGCGFASGVLMNSTPDNMIQLKVRKRDTLESDFVHREKKKVTGQCVSP